MKLIIAEPVRIALNTLSNGDRQRVQAWLDRLRNWENDQFVQSQSVSLDLGGREVRMLRTSTDLRIFYTIDQDTITVLDVARKETILSSGNITGAG
jgi:hypothetical protein